jgi:hypothetical protein
LRSGEDLVDIDAHARAALIPASLAERTLRKDLGDKRSALDIDLRHLR